MSSAYSKSLNLLSPLCSRKNGTSKLMRLQGFFQFCRSVACCGQPTQHQQQHNTHYSPVSSSANEGGHVGLTFVYPELHQTTVGSHDCGRLCDMWLLSSAPFLSRSHTQTVVYTCLPLIPLAKSRK